MTDKFVILSGIFRELIVQKLISAIGVTCCNFSVLFCFLPLHSLQY